MGSHRTAWHFYFTILLRRRGPSWIEVRDEVPLSEERPRMDYLFLRKLVAGPVPEPGLTLRGLWPHLPLVTIAELKSIGRPYAAGNLDRLWGYAHLYYAPGDHGLGERDELCALLIVPNRTPALDADTKAMRLEWVDLGGGYWELSGGLFRLYVAELDVVAAREDDDVLRLFSHDRTRTAEGRRFWAEMVGTKEAMMQAHDLEGYDEVLQKFLGQLSPEQRMAGLAPQDRMAGLAPQDRMAGLAPQDRVAGLAPEERVAGLAPEELILTLPDDVLRCLSSEILASLPAPARDAIRKRIGR